MEKPQVGQVYIDVIGRRYTVDNISEFGYVAMNYGNGCILGLSLDTLAYSLSNGIFRTI